MRCQRDTRNENRQKTRSEEGSYGCERVLLLYPALFEYRRLSARIHAVLLRKPGERGCRVGSAAATEQVICPTGDFGRLMPLMRYLCENGVGLGHWMEVLDDAGVTYWPCMAAEGGRQSGKPTRFVAFAGFEGENLVHNPELTQSV